MKDLRTIRTILGLSQQQVAEWLGVSRSVVTNFESGARNMPIAAQHQLVRLGEMVEAMESGRVVENTVEEAVNKADAYYVAECARKLEIFRDELAAMRNSYVQVNKWIVLLQELLVEPKNETERMWLQWQLGEAKEKLEACGAAAQWGLEVRIAGLEGVVNFKFENVRSA